jgi:hypothetical protein
MKKLVVTTFEAKKNEPPKTVKVDKPVNKQSHKKNFKKKPAKAPEKAKDVVFENKNIIEHNVLGTITKVSSINQTQHKMAMPAKYIVSLKDREDVIEFASLGLARETLKNPPEKTVAVEVKKDIVEEESPKMSI